MERYYWRYVLLFILLLLIQVLLLNSIRWGGYINPQLYILFVLILPVNVAPWLLLVSAFSLGLLVDTFSDSLAIHAAATTCIAFFRPGIIRLLTGNIREEGTKTPSFSTFGGPTLAVYSFILVFIHHTLLFYLELFHFREMWQTLSRITLSTFLTFFFVILGFALLNRSFSR